LDGTAEVIDGSTVDAFVRVQVTEPVEANVARDDGVVASATFTESGYSADRLRNGDTGEKAWSNWKPGDTKNPTDTVTFTLPTARDVSRVVTHFYRDGNNPSVAQSLRVEVRDADGVWVDASGEIDIEWDGSGAAPVVDVPVSASSVDGVRVVMTARPAGYMTLSEIEVFAAGPGASSDAAAGSIAVDGELIAGFDPEIYEYRVVDRPPQRSTVTAAPRDPYATVTVVEVDSAERGAREFEITVESEDGTESREYTVMLLRR
jgi:hypothetical protein